MVPRRLVPTLGSAPALERGFLAARDVVRPERSLVVYSGVDRFPLAEGIEAVSLADLCRQLSEA